MEVGDVVLDGRNKTSINTNQHANQCSADTSNGGDKPFSSRGLVASDRRLPLGGFRQAETLFFTDTDM